MLREVYVDGFRSLSNFSLELQPGLNILIGPNGSGKTNIVSFFEFISSSLQGAISEAVLGAGGVAAVFARQPALDQKRRPVRIRLSGDAPRSGAASRSWNKKRLKYTYECIIEISDQTEFIYYSRQVLKIAISDSNGLFRFGVNQQLLWDLHVISRTNETLRAKSSVEKFNHRLSRSESYFFPKDIERAKFIEARLDRFDLASRSIFDATEMILPGLRGIKSDIASGRSYNIYPNTVKAREDLSYPSGVSFDGRGTSSTLFTLWKTKARPEHHSRPQRIFSQAGASRPLAVSPKLFDEVIELLRLVNDSIEDCSIKIDPIENFIRVIFEIRTENGNIEIPLQNMSDGTAKWIALITAILTNRTLFSIEEPENYLHPYMQKELLEIMRGTMIGRDRENFAILTSHSETLLNSAKPDEVIVVSMEMGVTHAMRLARPKELAEKIKSTGFGLGYYYLSGVLPYA